MDRDSCKSALSWLHMLFYITQGVLMAVFAPAIIQPAWLPTCLDLHILGQFCQPFSWWLVFSTSYPRLNPFELEVVAVVISSWWSHWWFYLGDFALVISRSINIIDHTLKNSPCFSNIFVWHFDISCHLHLVFEFFNYGEFFNYNKFKYHGSWSTAGCPW